MSPILIHSSLGFGCLFVVLSFTSHGAIRKFTISKLGNPDKKYKNLTYILK